MIAICGLGGDGSPWGGLCFPVGLRRRDVERLRECVGYKWKQRTIFPRARPTYSPRWGNATGDGSFSPTADGYDLRIEPVASLPKWIDMQRAR